MRVASIDIGTNTALMLVADVQDGTISEIREERETVRLGEGVDESGHISSGALRRLRTALQRYKTVIDSSNVDRVVATGTSASRDAANGNDIEDIVREEVGVPYEILSGEIEALLTFLAATGPGDDQVAVVDIGGGSTEIVYGSISSSGPKIDNATSFDIGSVRLTERLISAYPVSQEEIGRTTTALKSIFNDIKRMDSTRQLVAIGGTATTASLLLRKFPPDQIRQNMEIVLSKMEIKKIGDLLLGSTVDQIYDLSPSLMSGRADVIGAGMLILGMIMDLTGSADVSVRFRGIRHAAALICASPTYAGSISAEATNSFP